MDTVRGILTQVHGREGRWSMASSGRMRMTGGICAGLMTIVLLLGAAPAMANSISYETAIALQSAPWGPTALNLPQFNPTMGTLTGVEIQLTSTSNATLTIKNNNTTTQRYSGSASIPVTVSYPVYPAPGVLSLTSTATTNTVSGVIAAGATVTRTGLTGTNGPVNAFVSSNAFSYYIGTGNIGSLTATAGTATASGSGSNIVYGASGSASGNVKIIYTFDTVSIPEPTALMLIGSGLMGLAFVARRRLA